MGIKLFNQLKNVSNNNNKGIKKCFGLDFVLPNIMIHSVEIKWILSWDYIFLIIRYA